MDESITFNSAQEKRKHTFHFFVRYQLRDNFDTESFACNNVKDMLSIASMLEACEKAKQVLGGPSALAEALSNLNDGAETISSQAVSQWKKVPAERVLSVEHVTGISRHDLRPDIYGAPQNETNGEAA
jgi:DNA-binding transcriptional regulator YdaS (Cro superfamily)